MDRPASFTIVILANQQPAWLVVLPVAVGPVATIVGLFLGSRLRGGVDDRQWRRAALLDAFAVLTGELHSVRIALGRLAVADPQSPDLGSLRGTVSDLWPSWNQAVARASLLSSQRVIDRIKGLEERLYPLASAVNCGGVAYGDWRHRLGPLDLECEALFAALRADLASPVASGVFVTPPATP